MGKQAGTLFSAHCRGINEMLTSQVSNMSQNLKIRRSPKVGY